MEQNLTEEQFKIKLEIEANNLLARKKAREIETNINYEKYLYAEGIQQI